MQSMDVEVVGAIKIKDGLFIGDEFAAQDLEFVVANKVTHIINTAGRQIPNHWEPIGVIYLTYYWIDNDSQIILDQMDQVSSETFNFIEDAFSKGESILVHSIKGQNRACTIIVSYIMRKYKWNLLKALEFMNYRRPDLEIRKSFIQQLSSFESRLPRLINTILSTKWSELKDKSYPLENEELIIRNTFLNAQLNPQMNENLRKANNNLKIDWLDKIKIKENNTGNLIATFIPDDIDIKNSNIKIDVHRNLKPLISIFRNPSFSQQKQTQNTIYNNKNPNTNKLENEQKINNNPKISKNEPYVTKNKPQIKQIEPKEKISNSKVVPLSQKIDELKSTNEEMDLKPQSEENLNKIEETEINKPNSIPFNNNFSRDNKTKENNNFVEIVNNIISNNNINNIILQNPIPEDLFSLGLIPNADKNETNKSDSKVKRAMSNQPRPMGNSDILKSLIDKNSIPNKTYLDNCKEKIMENVNSKESIQENEIEESSTKINVSSDVCSQIKSPFSIYQEIGNIKGFSDISKNHQIQNKRGTNTAIQNALNAIRNGPVKPANEKANNPKTNQEKEKIGSNLNTNPASRIKKPRMANVRPSSPGIQGKKVASPYTALLNKASQSLAGSKRIGSAIHNNSISKETKKFDSKLLIKSIATTKAKFKL